MKYVAVDIGCIECGELSAVLGIFSKKSMAQRACKKAAEEQRKKWRGQHSFEVFEVAEEDVEYIPRYLSFTEMFGEEDDE